jgi:uncharacterized repeat protein (TIGR02543 family)
VVGIIAILAGIVIVAINPSRQLATARDAERRSDLKQINSALLQYYIDNQKFPDTVASDTLTEICNSGSGDGTDCLDGTIDLSVLVPKYLSAIPADPNGHTATTTGYHIALNSSHKPYLKAPNTEIPGTYIAIGSGTGVVTPATYTVTFDNQGADTLSDPTSIDVATPEASTVVTLPTPPIKTNLVFEGWFTGIDGTGTHFTQDTVVTEDITVYAKWGARIIPACGNPADSNCWSVKVNGLAWGPIETTTGITDGTYGIGNTLALVALPGDYPAAEYCDSLDQGGNTDWYLPAYLELYDGVLALGTGIKAFPPAIYWSSTESMFDGKASGEQTGNGFFLHEFYKNNSYSVRCLR